MPSKISIFLDKCSEYLDQVYMIPLSHFNYETAINHVQAQRMSSDIHVSTNQDITWMQIPMNKVIQENHLHNSLKPKFRQMLSILRGFPPLITIIQNRLPMHKRLHQNLLRRQIPNWLRKLHPRIIRKIPPKPPQITRFHPQIQLRQHNIPKLLHGILHGQIIQIQIRHCLHTFRNLVQNVKIHADLVQYMRMGNFDRYIRSLWQQRRIHFQFCLVYLRDASGSNGRNAISPMPLMIAPFYLFLSFLLLNASANLIIFIVKIKQIHIIFSIRIFQ
mmetsp:Transcript_16897/g.25365  ORF Transcript_16897/g.25365 Transcript_16897/m.25365 type:complete len:275 (+) Transcript_16897:435-1259(+)